MIFKNIKWSKRSSPQRSTYCESIYMKHKQARLIYIDRDLIRR